ncbi:GD22659 [Drosophila simulans]|uniref:GD22659 n=1 Tax=Drosophila simulans TaxID=7240 RepID=B4Q3J9_DROSI|nr:GD22659 [Drosophila simulans]
MEHGDGDEDEDGEVTGKPVFSSGEFSANVQPDVEAMAAAALSGMEMGSGPGSEGYEDADNEKSKAMENVALWPIASKSLLCPSWFASPSFRFSASGATSQRLAVHRMTPTLEKSHLGGTSSSSIHNPGI